MKSNKKRIIIVQSFQCPGQEMCVAGVIKCTVLGGLLGGRAGAQLGGNIGRNANYCTTNARSVYQVV